MKQANTFLNDLLDHERMAGAGERIWRVAQPACARINDGDFVIETPFEALLPTYKTTPDPELARRTALIVFRAYGDAAVRVATRFSDSLETMPDSPMLDPADDLRPMPLRCVTRDTGWDAVDEQDRLRVRIETTVPPTRIWDGVTPRQPPQEPFVVTVYPEGRTPVAFQSYDTFHAQCSESFPLAFVDRDGCVDRCAFSLHADPSERFAGAGERFARLDLTGQTLILENADALGVNNRRCYKNVPFYLSSRPYGLFIHSHDHQRLSLADVSTRAAQAVVESPSLDLFFVGGGSPERILFNYRRLTGFPPPVPRWSYGTWMSRMSYGSADQVDQVADRLRRERFPCDVLHVDVNWFAEEWICDWEFDPVRFPDPESWIARLRKRGFRLSLWQLPHVARACKWYADASEKGYVRFDEANGKLSESIFSGLEFIATLDLTNPEAVEWYKDRLRPLLAMGVASIKADFGEHIHKNLDYHGMSGKRLHNLFGLLYQQAVFEAIREVDEQPVLFARCGWAGAQRYPVHWGGDCAASWDGLAGSLRGGLHLGASGFGYWTCDVPGFHGVPDFFLHWPSELLYLRWTQAAVFLSHIRYHGAQPREPYEYPGVADQVRQWWRLRYALIPYLMAAGQQTGRSGYPVMRALFFHDPDDPLCWVLDDQFLCGDALLVAPVMNDTGIRSVYLPKGKWIDIWSGERMEGPCWLHDVVSPPGRIPVYALRDARIPVYPDEVNHTGEMDDRRIVELAFDESYRDFKSSVLGPLTGIEG